MEAIGNTRAIEITRLAMDGLMKRQQAITANTANVMTPNYQRKEVVFEDQLKNIIAHENLKDDIKLANSASLSYRATSQDVLKKPTQQQMALLNQSSFNSYQPEIIRDMARYNPNTENNVDIEKEMMDMAKAGTQYAILADLEGRQLSGLSDVIRGGGNG